MKEKYKKLWQLFLTFFKIGGFTFGGGHAMIPLIQRETVENKKWITDDDILEIIAIAESTPGPVAINSATFVGYRTAGFWGAVEADEDDFTAIGLDVLVLLHNLGHDGAAGRAPGGRAEVHVELGIGCRTDIRQEGGVLEGVCNGCGLGSSGGCRFLCVGKTAAEGGHGECENDVLHNMVRWGMEYASLNYTRRM